MGERQKLLHFQKTEQVKKKYIKKKLILKNKNQWEALEPEEKKTLKYGGRRHSPSRGHRACIFFDQKWRHLQ